MSEHPGLVQHPKTGMYLYRRRVPRDLHEYMKKAEYKVSLGTKDRAEAKLLCARIHRETNDRWDSIKERRRNRRIYDTRTADAVAGEVYRRFFAKNLRSPRDHRVYLVSGKHFDDAEQTGFFQDFKSVWLPAFQMISPAIVEIERDYGLREYEKKEMVLTATAKALKHACSIMYCRVRDGYVQEEVDGHLQFPPLIVRVRKFEDIFADYCKDKALSQGTIKRWRPIFKLLLAYVGHDDLGSIHRNDIRSWLRDLRASGVNPVTLRDVYLGSIRSLFGWLRSQEMLKEDPTEGVAVYARAPERNRPNKSLNKEEALLILRATLQVPGPGIDPFEAAARRWIPWLCAYTGARVNELTQLRRCDVFQLEGVHVIRITPAAGKVKNRRPRDIPLHSHLIEQGFLDFVRRSSEGPLFYDFSPEARPVHRPRSNRPAAETMPTPMNERVGARLARWLRSIGIDDPEVAPNHGWRHRFNTAARKAKMDREKRDAIKGHAPASVGEEYGEFDMEDLSDEIEKLPRYKLLEVLTRSHADEAVAEATRPAPTPAA